MSAGKWPRPRGHVAAVTEDVGAGEIAHGRVGTGGIEGGDLLGAAGALDGVELEVAAGLLGFQLPHGGVEIARGDGQHSHPLGPEPGGLVSGVPDDEIFGDGIGGPRPGTFRQQIHPGQTFTRLQLLDEIWGMDSDSDERTVNVHINRLRTRFYGWPEFEIQTVRGLGYRAVKQDD